MRCQSNLLVAAVVVASLLAWTGPAAAAGPDEPVLHGLDRELYRYAEAIPGFGGLYFDRAGRPNVHLLDPAQGETLRRLQADVRIHQADYDFRHLAAWRADLRSVLAHGGVVFLDVDERANRIRIGVDASAPAGAVRAVREALAFHGVPADAVVVEQADPIHRAATLRDRHRPVPGGVQIHFGNFLCTLTFNATRDGVFGHVTNSHCTNTQGGVEGTEYFQPTSTVDPSRISVEIADPDYFRRGECPRGRKCRFSDSAFADYDADSLGQLGAIARTTSRDPLQGTLTIDSSSPRFSIAGEVADPVAGQELNKVGRTTGWTFGDVDSTCVDVNVSGSNITQLCQTIVNAGVGSGDSGSPVFSWSGGDSVDLYGVLWGGNSAGTLFVFSPMSGIERELGPLTTH